MTENILSEGDINFLEDIKENKGISNSYVSLIEISNNFFLFLSFSSVFVELKVMFVGLCCSVSN